MPTFGFCVLFLTFLQIKIFLNRKKYLAKPQFLKTETLCTNKILWKAFFWFPFNLNNFCPIKMKE